MYRANGLASLLRHFTEMQFNTMSTVIYTGVNRMIYNWGNWLAVTYIPLEPFYQIKQI